VAHRLRAVAWGRADRHAPFFHETYQLWQSRAAALFATVVYVTNLPALLYASQLFPTMLASVTAFGAFILVVRVLPTAMGWRSIVAGGGIGVLAAVLPWLHVKYAPLALVVVAAALVQLAAASRAARARLGGRYRTRLPASPRKSLCLRRATSSPGLPWPLAAGAEACGPPPR
jgi:hypothetical protein